MFTPTSNIEEFSVDKKFGDIRVVISPDREVNQVSSVFYFYFYFLVINLSNKNGAANLSDLE